MQDSLLTIQNLSIAFADSTVVDDVSLSLHKGEMLALVGESGSGKSLTASAIMQLQPEMATLNGTIIFDGQTLLGDNAIPRPALRTLRGHRISMIFQEPMSALNPLHTIGRQIAEVMRVHHPDWNKARIHKRLHELLEQVGLSDFINRMNAYPHELSGGQRQRVMIAIAMANEPDILIADEPTTALDVTLQEQVLSLLKELQRTHDMAILLITHDLTIVKRLAERVAIMRQGHIVEQGDTQTIFKNPQHDYTQMLLSSAPTGSALPIPANAPEVMRCDDLKVHFPLKSGLLQRVRGHVKAVDGINLSVKQGQTIGIVGESGSGKTTLALALLRLIHSDGSIVFLGDNLREQTRRTLRTLRQQMQLVFQDPYASLNPRLTVGQIIGEGIKVHQPQWSRAARMEKVAQILTRVGLDPDMMARHPHAFSGGQRQRIAIARAMILRPRFVVLDEPTSALDLTVQRQVIELLKDFQLEESVSFLFISHDLRVIRAISHEILVMKNGQMVEHQPTEALFTQPQSDYTKALITASGI